MGLFNGDSTIETDIGHPNKEIYCTKDRSRNNPDYSHCKGCPLQGNPKVWAWRGNWDAKLCFVGMNPGLTEKIHKIPFVGPSGKKFHERVTTELDINGRTRTYSGNDVFLTGEFYVTNVVKCWTDNNSNPPSEAIARCWNHLEPELEGREIIVPLGNLVQNAFHKFYHGPAIIHEMTHPSAACRKGLYEARLIHETKKLKQMLRE